MNSLASPATAKKDDGYDKWQAHDDLMTLVRAKEIQGDAKRMKHVRRAAKEKMEEQAKIKAIASGSKP